MLGYLISGITLGAAAGLSPGPLLAFLVAQTLRYGLREGVKVALAPVLTDFPIVVATLVLLSRLSDSRTVLAVISIAGGLYVMWLGVESIRIRQAAVSSAAASPHSIRRSMMVNFLNPHVYIFWMTVGGPLVLEGAGTGPSRPAMFMAAFYVCLCGSKIAIAVLLDRSRGFLAGAAYLWTVRALGLVLIAFGVWLVASGAVSGSLLVQ